MDDEKVLDERMMPDIEGEFSDIIEATRRVGEIICTASRVTNETAKKDLLAGVRIILEDCIEAIDRRFQGEDEPVLEDD